MPRRLAVLALPLGFVCALALGACGSGNSHESGATVPAPSLSSGTTVPATRPATTGTTSTATAPTTPATTPSATQTTPSQPTGGATTTQPSGGAPAGCPPAVGGFIRDLRASDCGVARTVASAWFDAVHDGAAPDGTIAAAGYSCSGTLAGERANVTCSGSGGTVAFTASP
ncbi:MAG TPA: hypothetical protein VF250_04020 [Conexibacter sp.]